MFISLSSALYSERANVTTFMNAIISVFIVDMDRQGEGDVKIKSYSFSVVL